MFVKNPKLTPQTLIDLTSYYKVRELEVYYKRPKWAKTEEWRDLTGRACVEGKSIVLFLRNICFNSSWKTHYGYWWELLQTFLHEVGHIKNPDSCFTENRYRKDETFHSQIEGKADHYVKKELARLLGLDGGLFEPEYLGIYDIVARKPDYDKIRARCVGSQYPLKDVILEIFDGHAWGKRYTEARTLVRMLAIKNNIGKIYKGRNGVKHFFFSYDEVERLKGARIIRAIREKFGIPGEWCKSIGYVARRHEQLMIKEMMSPMTMININCKFYDRYGDCRHPGGEADTKEEYLQS